MPAAAIATESTTKSGGGSKVISVAMVAVPRLLYSLRSSTLSSQSVTACNQKVPTNWEGSTKLSWVVRVLSRRKGAAIEAPPRGIGLKPMAAAGFNTLSEEIK